MDLFINDKSMSHSAAVRTPLSPSMELTLAAASGSLPLLIMISLLSCPFPFFLVSCTVLHASASIEVRDIQASSCCGIECSRRPGSRNPGPDSVQVSQGMAALESLDPPIVHRDLKTSNVFIDGGGCARVADMNLSLRLHPESLVDLTGETGTYFYMSPEMMRHEVRPSIFIHSWVTMSQSFVGRLIRKVQEFLGPLHRNN
jgi:serine/threonine protein kinase